jgi:vacuolar-type H+-ATPase subunit H
MAENSTRNGAGPSGNLREAEEAVDRMSERAGEFVMKTLARAREEAEDIWAEARALSQRR